MLHTVTYQQLPSLSAPQSRRNRMLAQEQKGFSRSHLSVARCLRFERQLPESPALNKISSEAQLMALMHKPHMAAIPSQAPVSLQDPSGSVITPFPTTCCAFSPTTPTSPQQRCCLGDRRRIRHRLSPVSASICWWWSICVGALPVSNSHLRIFLNRHLNRPPSGESWNSMETHISDPFRPFSQFCNLRSLLYRTSQSFVIC